MKNRILTVFLVLILAGSFALCGAYADSGTSKSSDLSAMEEKIASLSYKEAQTLYNQGSYGFFNFVGSEHAAKVLTGAHYASSTSIGSAKDATSLGNMKKAIAFLKECNNYREKEGLSDFRVTDYMMAVAQSNCNASSYRMYHTGQFGVQENLAWGLEDPFTRWYTKERASYKAGNRSSYVAHYKNLIRPYDLTGFAVNQKGNYNITASQVFDYSDLKGYSVEYYSERFNTYYNALKKRLKK